MTDLTGRRLGSYDLVRKLGQGGMGAVYVGVHRTLHTPRAIKVLLQDVDEGIVERFVREGQISASLRHPNIVEVYDVGEEDDVHFLVMELVEGESLLQLVRRDGALSLDRVIRLLRQVADALDYAHARGVVHRDVKPSNVIVGPNDQVTLIDFGIARALDQSRMTRAGVVVGTFEYMAPEIVTEGGGSPGADRYALGIVAYQMLTGRVPFTGESAHSIMYRQVHDPPPPPSQFRPDLRGPVENALMRQLSKAPDDRFPSSQAFVDALAASLAQPYPETQATSIADITRSGFDRPTPGSGRTPLPRSGRTTRPAAAVTMTPPSAWAVPSTPPGPVERGEAAPAAGYAEPVVSPALADAGPSSTARPGSRPWSRPALVVGLVAVLVVLAAVALIAPLREAVMPPGAGSIPTTAPAVVERPTPAVTPMTATPHVATPTPQPATQTPRVVTATPQAITPTPPPPTQTPAPRATLTANQRLAQVRDTFEAGNHASALAMLAELRGSSPTLSGLDDTEYEIRMGLARTLLERGDPDGAYEQFGGALAVRPGDAVARAGQERIVLAKNYAIMEAAWGRDDDRAIKALEENMVLDPGYRESRSKLYALLIIKADRLLTGGERDAAFPILMRALDVLPDAGEAQRRLASYTPTPTPVLTPAPAAPAIPAPASRPSTGINPGAGSTTSSPSQGSNPPPSAPGPNTGTPDRSACPGGVCP